MFQCIYKIILLSGAP